MDLIRFIQVRICRFKVSVNTFISSIVIQLKKFCHQMASENNETESSIFLNDNIVQSGLMKYSKGKDAQPSVDLEVPSALFCSHDEAPLLQSESNGRSRSEPFAQKYANERKIAYVQMSRKDGGSAIVLEDCSKDQDAIPGWDHTHDMAYFTKSDDQSTENLLRSGNVDNLHKGNLKVNYVDIDFLSTPSTTQANLIIPMFSTRTEYAHIDFSKTVAVSKTGKELVRGRRANVPNEYKTLTNQKNGASPMLLKKASSCFYVSMPMEYLNYSKPLGKPESTSAVNSAFATLPTSADPTSQRKFSLDFVDASRHSNTLPHSKKKIDHE